MLDIFTLNELTAIIAHEFGHVVLRHRVKKIVQGRLFRLLFQAALFSDADRDGVQEPFYEEIAGMVIGKHAETVEKTLNKLGLSWKEKEKMVKKLSKKVPFPFPQTKKRKTRVMHPIEKKIVAKLKRA